MNGPLDTRAGAARRRAGVLIALAVLTVAGLGLAVTVGSTPLPLGAVAAAVARDGDPGVETIVWTVRLPRAVTALVAGAALSAAGLQMQTLFRNPLAEPYILGVSSGASLGVALVVTGVGGAGGMFTAGVAGFGRIGIVLAATAGAAAVLVLVLLLSRRVRSLSTLLVIGVLIGAATVSLISLMLTYTDPRLAQQYLAWGLGSFAGTTWDDLAVFVPVCAGALAAALAGVKPLNALLLGERYARTMGVNVRRTRTVTILVASVLAGAVTACCGPIAFLGMAVPHIARLLIGTADHRVLMPTVMLLGSGTALLCCVATQAPGAGAVLPLNAITTLIGTPVVITVLLRSRAARIGVAV